MRLDKVTESVKRFMAQHNPLFLREFGDIQYYNDRKECYKAWLEKMREHYPSGYIEVEYAVAVEYDLRINDVRSMFKNPFIKSKDPWILYVNWRTLDHLTRTGLQALVERLHKMLGTIFVDHLFNDAINEFYETEHTL